LGLNAIMPLLEVVHSLIKFTWLHDVFMCDFIMAMKICEGDVYQINCDNHFYFQGDVFGNIYAIIYFTHESMSS